MSNDVDDRSVNAHHRVAQQRENGLSTELAAELKNVGHKYEVTKCEIITLPGLHNRRTSPIYAMSPGATALVIEFPAPKWQRNAARHEM